MLGRASEQVNQEGIPRGNLLQTQRTGSFLERNNKCLLASSGVRSKKESVGNVNLRRPVSEGQHNRGADFLIANARWRELPILNGLLCSAGHRCNVLYHSDQALLPIRSNCDLKYDRATGRARIEITRKPGGNDLNRRRRQIGIGAFTLSFNLVWRQ